MRVRGQLRVVRVVDGGRGGFLRGAGEGGPRGRAVGELAVGDGGPDVLDGGDAAASPPLDGVHAVVRGHGAQGVGAARAATGAQEVAPVVPGGGPGGCERAVGTVGAGLGGQRVEGGARFLVGEGQAGQRGATTTGRARLQVVEVVGLRGLALFLQRAPPSHVHRAGQGVANPLCRVTVPVTARTRTGADGLEVVGVTASFPGEDLAHDGLDGAAGAAVGGGPVGHHGHGILGVERGGDPLTVAKVVQDHGRLGGADGDELFGAHGG